MFKFVKENFFILVISLTSLVADDERVSGAQALQPVLSRTEFHTHQDKLALFTALGVQYTSDLIIQDWMRDQESLSYVTAPDPRYKKYNDYLASISAMHAIVPLSIKFINDQIGYGVFARTQICTGHCIGEYTGRVASQDDCSSGIYAWDYPIINNSTDDLREYVVDGSICGNELRFVNDAGDASNCMSYDIVTPDGIPHVMYVALRDIQPGEQLTINYGNEYWCERNDF